MALDSTVNEFALTARPKLKDMRVVLVLDLGLFLCFSSLFVYGKQRKEIEKRNAKESGCVNGLSGLLEMNARDKFGSLQDSSHPTVT